MLLLCTLARSLNVKELGVYRFDVEPHSSLSLECNADQQEVLLFNSSGVPSVDVEIVNRNKKMIQTGYDRMGLFAEGQSITLKALDSHLSILLWVLKSSDCKGTGFVYYGDKSVSFQMTMGKKETDICLFNIANGASTTRIADLKPDSLTEITFFTKPELPMVYKGICEVTTTREYYVRVRAPKDNTVLKIGYSGSMTPKEPSDCLVRLIPFISASEELYVRGNDVRAAALSCSSSDFDDMSPMTALIYVLSFFALAAVILISAKLTGAISQKKKEEEEHTSAPGLISIFSESDSISDPSENKIGDP